MNWDSNPKQRFTQSHLERCYDLPSPTTAIVHVRETAPAPQKNNKNMLSIIFSPIRFVSMIIIGSLLLGVVTNTEVEEKPSMEYNDNVPSLSE